MGEGLSSGLAADGLADDVGVGLCLAEALADGVSIGRVQSAVLELVAEGFDGRSLVAGLSQRCSEDIGGGGRFLALVLVAGRRVRAKSDLALMLRGDQYAVSDFVSDSDARAIEVHMANLRRKLGESPAQPRWIETVRGVGYRLTA